MFISDKFYFDGIHSDEKCVCIASMDSDILNKYGLSYNQDVFMHKFTTHNSYFTNQEENIDNVTFQIFLVDENQNPIAWEFNKLQDIVGWLITDDFKAFISEDNLELVYYFKTVGIEKIFDSSSRGYLEVTFKPFSNFSYRQFNRSFIVDGEKVLSFNNYSNVEFEYYPITEIINSGDENTVFRICNMAFGDTSFEISGMKNGEHVVIDHLLGTVINSKNENLIHLCNRKWIKMHGCNNSFRFEGDGNIRFKAQFPIRA